MNSYIEIDLGAGFGFAGIAAVNASAERVDSLAKQLVVLPRWDGDEPPQFPSPSADTLTASSSETLCGVLDDDAVEALGLQLPGIDVQAVVEQAKRARWGGVRVRALIA